MTGGMTSRNQPSRSRTVAYMTGCPVGVTSNASGHERSSDLASDGDSVVAGDDDDQRSPAVLREQEIGGGVLPDQLVKDLVGRIGDHRGCDV